MAALIDLITVGETFQLVLDSDPSQAPGFPATPGSEAVVNIANVGYLYLKKGVADTAWEVIPTLTTGNVGPGVFGRLAIYNTTGTGYTVDDTITQNSQLIDVNIAAQASRATPIQYTIPNPGNSVTAADFVLTEGAQSINGNKTFNGNTTVNGDFTVHGTMTYLDTTNTTVTDKLITLNKGGAANSGFGVGFEIEENAVITGYFSTSADAPTNKAFLFKAPDSFEANLSLANLLANRIYNLPDEAGRVLIQDQTTPGVAAQIPYFSTVNKVVSPTGSGIDSLAWDETNKRLGIGIAAPTKTLHVNGGALINGDIRQSSASGVAKDVLQAAVTTTDATVTNLASITVPTGVVGLLVAEITCRKTAGAGAGAVGDGATYVRQAKIKNIGGSVTLQSLQSTYTAEDVSGFNATIDVTGTTARIRVTGAANDTVLWHTTYSIQYT